MRRSGHIVKSAANISNQTIKRLEVSQVEY